MIDERREQNAKEAQIAQAAESLSARFGPVAAVHAEAEVIRLSRDGQYEEAMRMIAIWNALKMDIITT